MKKRIFLIGGCGLIFLTHPVLAQTQTVYAEQIQDVPLRVNVYKGSGVILNFIPSGNVITDAKLDDPSKIGMSFNGMLCATMPGQQSCRNNDSKVTVVHLRQINEIPFPGLPKSSDGGTLLSVFTLGWRGEEIYQFRVYPVASGTPPFTRIDIRPGRQPARLAMSSPPNQSINAPINQDAMTARPTILVARSTENSVTKSTSSTNRQVIADANALALGLSNAHPSRGNRVKIAPNSQLYKKVQTAIALLRRGVTQQEAARIARIDKKLIEELIALIYLRSTP